MNWKWILLTVVLVVGVMLLIGHASLKGLQTGYAAGASETKPEDNTFPPDKYLADLEVGEKLRWQGLVFMKTAENTWQKM